MTYITNLYIIFWNLLDNLTKVIYNGISDFVSSRFLRRIGLVLLVFLLLFAFSGAVAVGAEELIFDIRFECFETDGRLRLFIGFPDGVAFCGAYLELIYDAGLCLEELTFSGDLPVGGVLSFADGGDRIAILLDGDGQVFEGGGVVAEFSFVDTPFGEVGFEIASGEAYLWENEDLVRLSVEGASVCYVIGGEPADARGLPELLEIRTADGGILTVGNAPFGCFSSGLEVFSVSLVSAEVCRFTVTSVTAVEDGESGFETLLRGFEGRHCLILRPVAYFRDGARYGEEKTVLIIDGNIYGENLGFSRKIQ